jgi:hypothetical protein
MKKFVWKIGNFLVVHFKMKVHGFTSHTFGALTGGMGPAAALRIALLGWRINLIFGAMMEKWML